jgi:hypothetical protein
LPARADAVPEEQAHHALVRAEVEHPRPWAQPVPGEQVEFQQRLDTLGFVVHQSISKETQSRS